MIRMERVSLRLDHQPILTDITFDLKAGDFIALAGSNGAGKSSLSKLCNGLYRPSSGSVFFDGQNMAQLRTSALARDIGFLFQNPDRQIFCTTVRDELGFGLAALGLTAGQRARRVDETLATFELDGSRNPMLLSRGERQRVALASLLIRRPRLLVLDEPTTGLDYRECMQMMQAVSALNREEGTAVLMVSHDMEVIHDFAGRMLVLADGRLLADGETDALMRDETLLEKASLRPPQILELCGRLGSDYERVRSTADMLEAIEQAKRTLKAGCAG